MSYADGKSIAGLSGIADECTMMAHGTRRVLVERALIDANVSGATAVVAARAGFRIVVLAYNYMSNGAVNAHWRSGSTPITGNAYMVEAGRGKVCPYNPKGWCATALGEALNLQLSASVAVGGEVTFVAIDGEAA
jgi:hypothetical protein